MWHSLCRNDYHQPLGSAPAQNDFSGDDPDFTGIIPEFSGGDPDFSGKTSCSVTSISEITLLTCFFF